MQTIYNDRTDQYIFTELYKSNGELHQGSEDGDTISGSSIIILEYKLTGVTISPAVIEWVESSKLWKITIPADNITQYGSMFVTINGTGIASKVIEVHVDIIENDIVTKDEFSQFSSDMGNDILNLKSHIDSSINTQVLDAMTDYDVVSITNLDQQLTTHIQEIMDFEIKTGRTFKEFIRIIDIIFTGIVTNAGSGTVTFTGSDGSTVYIMGDNLGNRSDIIVNLL
jgi:polyhydroxyalkanoate synthesis regulator phasin